MIEAAFKAFARALRAAVALDPTETGVPSTKGTLILMSAAPAESPSGVVDYGMGNRRSVEKALERVGARAFVSRDHAELRAADGLLLPGVGAFPAAMEVIRELGLDELLRKLVGGGDAAVRVVHGDAAAVRALRGARRRGGPRPAARRGARAARRRELKLPHIGWSEVRWRRRSALNEGLPDPAFLYHVHSFVAVPRRPGGGAGDGGVRGDLSRGGRTGKHLRRAVAPREVLDSRVAPTGQLRRHLRRGGGRADAAGVVTRCGSVGMWPRRPAT